MQNRLFSVVFLGDSDNEHGDTDDGGRLQVYVAQHVEKTRDTSPEDSLIDEGELIAAFP